jgi:hypothetical protein
MNEEPRKMLLRTADVLRWTGLSRNEFNKLRRLGLVTGISLRPGGRSFYQKEHIRQAIIQRMEEGSKK